MIKIEKNDVIPIVVAVILPIGVLLAVIARQGQQMTRMNELLQTTPADVHALLIDVQQEVSELRREQEGLKEQLDTQ